MPLYPTLRASHAAVLFLIFGLPCQLAAETLIVANKAEATASLIDLDTGAVRATLPTGDGPHEVAVAPDGRLAVVTNYGRRDSAGNSLTLIDVPGARVVKAINLGDYSMPHGVEWLDDERVAVTVEANRALIVVHVPTGDIVQVLETDQDISHMVALDPEGRRAFTANIGSGSITVLDLASGKRVRNIPTGDGAEGLAVAPGTRQIWVTNRGADTVTVLDGETFEVVREIESTGFPIRATATPAGHVLVTRARAGDLVIYDAGTFETVRTIAFEIGTMDVEERLFGDRFGDSSVPIGVIADPAAERAFVAHANADVITEIDLASGEILRILRAGREPDGMGYSSLSVAGPESG
jgi:YVTN family beta-propeller protein